MSFGKSLLPVLETLALDEAQALIQLFAVKIALQAPAATTTITTSA